MVVLLPRGDYDAIREHYAYTSRFYAIDRNEGSCLKWFRSSRNRIIKPACVPITILSLLIIALVFLPLFNEEELVAPFKLPVHCTSSCSAEIVESIPTGLELPQPRYNSTADAWINLIDNAEKYVDISAMYWNLNSSDYPTAIHGKMVFEALIRAGKRGVRVRIAQDSGRRISDDVDSKYLSDNHLADVRNVNMSQLIGSGIVHTKFIITDIESAYVGSANMDWKSLSEVKELGIVVRNCSCVAADLYRIFAVYWKLGEEGARIPQAWPISYRTQYNYSNPAQITFNGRQGNFFISSSPAPFNPKGREHDLNAIKNVIADAEQTVCIEVMDYLPQTLYAADGNIFWPELDNAIRDAAFRGVRVRLLLAKWDHTGKPTAAVVKSMLDYNGALFGPKKGSIEVKWFVVPATPEQKKNPFTRVNHAKFLVTENASYIGTSNWVGDYFISTTGVGFVQQSKKAAAELQAIFDRDWNSPYAKET